LHIIQQSSDVEALCAKVKDNGGLYLVPAFTGLGAPYWNQHARGIVVGITRGSSDAHLARAAVESIAFQSMDLLKAMEADAGLPIRELRVDGGATVNNQLMQFQSDILNTKVVRPSVTETTALGAAYLAGLAVGYWSDIAEVKQYWQEDRSFEPAMEGEQRKSLQRDWKRAVRAAQAWTEDID
jgi:glycerol kinase